MFSQNQRKSCHRDLKTEKEKSYLLKEKKNDWNQISQSITRY